MQIFLKYKTVSCHLKQSKEIIKDIFFLIQGYLTVLSSLEQDILFFKFVLFLIYIPLTPEKNLR